MKKLFTLLTAAAFVVGAHAQEEILLPLGGGWNHGFAADADVYSYTVNKQWGAAEFACNVLAADYPHYVLEFEEPLPANFQINYLWKESAEATGDAKPEYGRAVGDGNKKSFDLYFDENHPYITGVAVQHTDEVEASLKIKKLTLKAANGEDIMVAPTFTKWAGTDNTVAYKGTVFYDGQWQQLEFQNVQGKSNLTIRVELAENAENVQMCVDYKDGTSEWPQFYDGKVATFTTKDGVEIKSVGLQRKVADAGSVKVNSATNCVIYPTSTAVANEGSTNYWGTYSNNLAAVELSGEGVEVYNVTLDGSENKLVFTKRADNKVAKGEGVIVKSNSPSFNVAVISDASTAAENLLKATPTTRQIIEGGDNTLYYLAFESKDSKKNLGFYWNAEDGTSLNAVPGKAYLAIPSSKQLSLRRSIVIDDSETTVIESVKADRGQQDAIYNIAGQRVNKLSKGVNIVGNNKIIIK